MPILEHPSPWAVFGTVFLIPAREVITVICLLVSFTIKLLMSITSLRQKSTLMFEGSQWLRDEHLYLRFKSISCLKMQTCSWDSITGFLVWSLYFQFPWQLHQFHCCGITLPRSVCPLFTFLKVSLDTRSPLLKRLRGSHMARDLSISLRSQWWFKQRKGLEKVHFTWTAHVHSLYLPGRSIL